MTRQRLHGLLHCVVTGVWILFSFLILQALNFVSEQTAPGNWPVVLGYVLTLLLLTALWIIITVFLFRWVAGMASGKQRGDLKRTDKRLHWQFAEHEREDERSYDQGYPATASPIPQEAPVTPAFPDPSESYEHPQAHYPPFPLL